jgi:hypothetical protein
MQLDFNLHRNQLPVFLSPAQLKVLVCGRAFGKTVLLLTQAVYHCLTYQGTSDARSQKVVALISPYLTQGRGLHWQPLIRMLEGQPFVKRIDRSNFRIEFIGNRPDLVVRGADGNAERLRGLNLVGAYLDEYQNFGPLAWSEVIFPALSRNNDWRAMIIGTPMGPANILHDIYQQAHQTPNWKAWSFKTEQNPFFPRKQLELAKQTLPPRTYRVEFEASFEAFEGQIFASLDDRHLLPHDQLEHNSTYIGFDWGCIHPAMTVVGLKGDQYFILDSWEPAEGATVSEPELIEEAARLCNKYRVYRCYLPDDRPAMIKSFRRAGEQKSILGLQRAVSVSRSKPNVFESLNILDSLFHQDRLFINNKLERLIGDFRSYHRETNRDGIMLAQPAKNQRDHTIDSARYCISTIEYKIRPTVVVPAPEPVDLFRNTAKRAVSF